MNERRPWRRLGQFLAATVLVSFVLNELWKMAQMSAYVEMAGRSWASTLGLCTRAAVGDVGIVLGISATGALAVGDLSWGFRGHSPTEFACLSTAHRTYHTMAFPIAGEPPGWIRY